MSIGSRVREERQRQKLTLKSLAEKSDISVSYLIDIEKDRSQPSLDRLIDLAKALNRSTAYFIDGTDSSGQEPNSHASESELKILLNSLMSQGEFLDIINELEDFENWSDREKEELLNFLKVKRNYKIHNENDKNT